MKKFILLIALFVGNIMLTVAQSDTTIYLVNQPDDIMVCLNKYDRVVLYGLESCGDFYWYLDDEYHSENPLIIEDEYYGAYHYIDYYGCGFEWGFYIEFTDDRHLPNSFTHYIWKRQNEVMTLQAVGNDSIGGYSYHWSTGEISPTIDVSVTGTYSCDISQICGTRTRTFIVKDNVEIVSASVDPSTNKNLVTWDVTPEQATYISNVIVNRDGVDMATVPYSDGQFLDNIGSDLAARIYTIVGVSSDGTLCPIQSLSRGTIHMAFLPDIKGNVEMTWNQPELGGADIHVGRFEICEYDPDSNEISVIDFVSSVTTSYSCNQSMFDYGYPLIRAIVQDGRGERDILSNRTNEIVGQPHEITIDLKPGWTWISYPYAVVKSFASALGDFVPMEGDIIKSQLGNSSYHNGQWRGNVQQFIPGFGYMYFSTRTAPTTLVFDLSSSRR